MEINLILMEKHQEKGVQLVQNKIYGFKEKSLGMVCCCVE